MSVSSLGNKEIMSKNIRYYMSINNVTQTDVCNTLGFKMSTFSDWIHARTYPRIDKIEMLANYFGIEKSDLVEDKKKSTESALSKKDEKDIARKLDETLKQLSSNGGLMFDGEALDDETKELLKISLENAIRTAKVTAKKKFTPKKYKKEQ